MKPGFGFFLLAISVAFGQSVSGNLSGIIGPQVRNAAGRVSGTASFPALRFIPPAVAGAPYSAEQVQEHVQTLNDGTRITQNLMRTKVYRDSAGRTRTERPLMMGLPNGADSPMVIEITDPVAGVRYTLDPQNRIAHRVAADPRFGSQGVTTAVTSRGQVGSVPPPAPPRPSEVAPAQIVISQLSSPAISASAARQESVEEKLPPQIIEGVLAEGVRRTTTIPASSQGNDRPFSITSETWTSPDLRGLMVLSKNDDPRSGENTTKLTNISRNEPDPSLFQPPPDYQIVDETAPFSIHFTQQ
ncbi:MAG TPA: hypothetical protein VH640_08495 [Bryobacteraceae bacterium]|jgi:hypothetical protein